MENYTDLYKNLESKYVMTIDEIIEKINSELREGEIKSFSIPKLQGVREIHQVSRSSFTWKIQRFLNTLYFSKISLPECAYGFKKGKSYFDFLSYHVSARKENTFLKLDIKEFFSSINTKKLIGELVREFEKDSVKIEKLELLFKLVLTFNTKIPQGFQTSPFLSNYYFRRIDLRIQKYCDKLKFKYSRYADDIILSSQNSEKLTSIRTISMFKIILKDFDLKLNKKKTKVAMGELVLSGFVISSEVRLSQKKLRELRRLLFIIEKYKKKEFDINEVLIEINSDSSRKFTKDYLLNYLSGSRSFLISSLKNVSSEGGWYYKSSKLIMRIEKSILKIY